jgi:hypothetical protein
MTLLISAFDNPTADFSVIQGLSGNGQVVAGASYPQGIPGVLTIENGIMRAFHADDHASTSGPRTEIYLTPDSYSAESWVVWEFMLPGAYWYDFTGIVTIGQFHDSPDGSDSTPRQPNFMLQFNNRNLQVVWPSAVLPTEVSASRQVSAIPLELDRWYQACIHFLWKDTTTGFREVFVDRVPVYREWNVPTSYTDTVAPYFKLGLYITNNGDLAGDKVNYVRNLKRYSGLESHANVMGGVPISRQTISQI